MINECLKHLETEVSSERRLVSHILAEFRYSEHCHGQKIGIAKVPKVWDEVGSAVPKVRSIRLRPIPSCVSPRHCAPRRKKWSSRVPMEQHRHDPSYGIFVGFRYHPDIK